MNFAGRPGDRGNAGSPHGYRVVEDDPTGYVSTGSDATWPGWEIDIHTIGYDPGLSCGLYQNNNFWDQPEVTCVFPLVVNTTDDADGACDGVHCSLRQAINCANIHPGAYKYA